MRAPEPAIRAERLGKAFQLARGPREDTLIGVLASPAAWLARLRARTEPFWALRNASFSVQPGEALGVIGRNGAGKSTLLKLLARITPPTEGRAVVRGRAAALLEVGTGFHPELSGRENIYLNGAILGMTRREIAQRFADIVEFSGVERFLDTPVKRYSSGMRTRLAFAVAAHLEPEILLIDEILAVGDAEFQRRCLSRMRTIAGGGRTVVFVSHNLSAVQQLCSRVLWLERGGVTAAGDTDEVIAAYLRAALPARGEGVVEFEPAPGAGGLVFRRATLREQACEGGARHTVEIEYDVLEPLHSALLVRIDAATGEPVATLRDTDLDAEVFRRSPGRYVSRCELPTRCLKQGTYLLTFIARDMNTRMYELREHVFELEVLQDARVQTFWGRAGHLLFPTRFELERLDAAALPGGGAGSDPRAASPPT